MICLMLCITVLTSTYISAVVTQANVETHIGRFYSIKKFKMLVLF